MTQIDGPFEVPGADGCHVNLPAWDMRPEWESYRVHPETPERVFAGDAPPFEQTVFLRFADEAEMRSILDLAPEE